jgi:hypothetical protein
MKCRQVWNVHFIQIFFAELSALIALVSYSDWSMAPTWAACKFLCSHHFKRAIDATTAHSSRNNRHAVPCSYTFVPNVVRAFIKDGVQRQRWLSNVGF